MIDKAKALHKDALFRNSVYLMLSTGTMAAFGFVFWLVVAHLYKPEQVGIASTLISAMNFITYFGLLGFNNTFIGFLPKSRSRNEEIDTGLVLVGIAGLVAGGLFVLFAPDFAPKLDVLHTNPLLGVGFMLLCAGATVNLVADSVFIAYRAAFYNFLIDGVIASSIQLALPIFLLALGAYGIFAAQGLAACAAMILSIIFLVKRFAYYPRFKIDRAILRKVVRYSSLNYVASLFNILPTIVLPLIILDKLGSAPAGYYYLAFMIANLLYTVAYAVVLSLFAEGSYQEQPLGTLIKRSALFLGAIIIPTSLLVGLLGPHVLHFFGKEYGEHSGRVIIILAANGPILAAEAIGGVVLRITKHMRLLVIGNIVYALSICGLALMWTHKGLSWAAAAWLGGQVITAAFTVGTVIFLQFRHRLEIARKLT